jgi:hypothetical protein
VRRRHTRRPVTLIGRVGGVPAHPADQDLPRVDRRTGGDVLEGLRD